MAFTFVKFPKKYLQSEEWHKPRKYSKAEALLWLINDPREHSIGYLAKAWQWSKSTVFKFLQEVAENGYCERFANGSANDLRTPNKRNNKELRHSAERFANGSANDLRTDNKEIENNIPPVLSTTYVVSNTIPPRGGSESDFIQEISEDFREVVNDWFSYKRERRESYKSHQARKAFYNKLKDLSHNDPSIAREIIDQSMANNWAGIFRLKTHANDQKRTTDTAGDTKSRLEGVLRAAAEGYARAHTPQEW